MSADGLRRSRATAAPAPVVPRGATADVFRNAGVVTPEPKVDGPDRDMWYKSSGTMVKHPFRKRPFGGSSFGENLRLIGVDA